MALLSSDLIALAVSLDGNGIKFGLGDNSNLSVEVDAKINGLSGDIFGDIVSATVGYAVYTDKRYS